MNQKASPKNSIKKPAGAPRLAPAGISTENGIDFAPSPAAVAQMPYHRYLSEGSPHGSDVQHWLAAEAELIAERNLS